MRVTAPVVAEVAVPPAVGALDGAWRLLLRLAGDPQAPPWVLVGGLMVELHAHEHGAAPPRETEDADVLVDLRARPGGLRWMVDWLQRHDLHLASVGPDDIGHRFVSSAGVSVDVLAPDHLGGRADLRTVPPARTIEAVAGTALLRRSQAVRITYGEEIGTVHRPDVASAVLGKYRAYAEGAAAPGRPRERHLEDAALLLSLLPDPRAAATELPPADCRRVGALAELLQENHPAWRATTRPADGQAALALLARASADST